MRRLFLLAVVVPLAGCDGWFGRSAAPTDDDLARLQAEIDAVVRTEATAAASCRVLLYGDKPCGGPNAAVIYSAEATDATALRRLTDRYTAAERDLNVREGRISDCAMFVGPTPVWIGGQCAIHR